MRRRKKGLRNGGSADEWTRLVGNVSQLRANVAKTKTEGNSSYFPLY